MFARTRLIWKGRNFVSSAIRQNEKKIENLKVAESLKAEPIEDFGKFPGMPKHTPSLLEKRFLVWSGHYKTIKDVPNRVEHEQMSKSKNWARIRLNLSMIGFSILMICGMVYMGKQDVKRRVTIESTNLAWHKKVNEEHQKSQNGTE